MAALLSGLTAAATLAACGVPPSGVIEAGEPASGMFSPSPGPPSPAAAVLFFLRDDELTAYRRSAEAGDSEAVVRLLFEGPTASESATATTELPRLTDASRVTTGADGILSVQLPDRAAPLSRRAMLQLVCTVAQAAPSLPLPAGADAAADDAAHDDDHDDHDGERATGGAAPSSTVAGSVRVSGNGWTMTQSDDACPLAIRSQTQPET